MDSVAHDVAAQFASRYGSPPAVIARAPGRVEVLGNHTDYNEGVVLSAAIDRYTYAAVGRHSGPEEMVFASTNFTQSYSFTRVAPIEGGAWVNYPLGVVAMLREAGHSIGPFRMLVHGTIPLGAGLSSSASLEVAAGLALQELFNLTISPEEMARLCQQAEHRFAGTKCGLLDQYSSLFGKKGHLLYIDFRSLEHHTVVVPGDDLVMAVTGSGVSHSLATSAYNDRRAECFEAAAFFSQNDSQVKTLRDISSIRLHSARSHLSSLAYKRALHVVGEDERVFAGMELLAAGDLGKFGQSLFASHESSRVNFENSCDELDVLVDIAGSIKGVYGSRLTGGGFGGATLTFLQRGRESVFSEAIREEYLRRTGNDAQVHMVIPADGACVLV